MNSNSSPRQQGIVNNIGASSPGTFTSLHQSVQSNNINNNALNSTSNLTNISTSPPQANASTSTNHTKNNNSGTASGSFWKSLFSKRQSSQGSSATKTSTVTATNSTTIYSNPGINISHITPRVIVMSTPRVNPTDIVLRQAIETQLKSFDSQYSQSYVLYSIERFTNDQLSYEQNLFQNKIRNIHLSNDNNSPCLTALLYFCQNVTSYLLESPSKTVIIHCHDSNDQLELGACSLLAYHQMFARVDQIIRYYERHRGTNTLLTMSQKRYIQYLCDLSHGTIERPHFQSLALSAINITPIPLINGRRPEYRPFVEIFNQANLQIFSTRQQPVKLCPSDANCVIEVNRPFENDLVIRITHGAVDQSQLNHANENHICELVINSNFATSQRLELSYLRNELDGVDQNNTSTIDFCVSLKITALQPALLRQHESFSKQLNSSIKKPLILFKDENELKQKLSEFDEQLKHNTDHTDNQNVPVSPQQPVVFRTAQSKFDSTSSDSISSSSSPRNSRRLSHSYSSTPMSPSSVSCFENPLNALMKQKELSPTSSVCVSLPLTEEKSIKKDTVMDALVDFGESDFNDAFKLERSISSDAHPHDFYSSAELHTNLLDDNLNVNNSTLPNMNLERPLLQPTRVTTIPTIEEVTQTTTKLPDTVSMRPSSRSVTNDKMPGTTPLIAKASNLTRGFSSPYSRYSFQAHDNDPLSGIDGLSIDPKPEPTVRKTIGESRKAAIAKDIDPTVLKVREWTEGKQKNIRALLCSLSTVTWPECKWKGCQMNELIDHEQVKKVYRKAVLYIHPDKLRNDPNEELAKLIFVELNEAWSHFEQESH